MNHIFKSENFLKQPSVFLFFFYLPNAFVFDNILVYLGNPNRLSPEDEKPQKLNSASSVPGIQVFYTKTPLFLGLVTLSQDTLAVTLSSRLPFQR